MNETSRFKYARPLSEIEGPGNVVHHWRHLYTDDQAKRCLNGHGAEMVAMPKRGTTDQSARLPA